ncbi:MAG: tRNA preQ1(34) S-adenosylmethionine ribosyltransferase-isomerase QueA [Candidatus Gastranaerophilales bacterium]|nr:tRNA preQ1(34) S-adenosylmethionine ribosyltransferase-isomerase QueA [Candidatus Gastranaerophilales bacterium]
MQLEEFNYNLPENLIAQVPAQKRDMSKMLVMDRFDGSLEHKHFCDITDYLTENDLLVLNNTKVIPARLYAKKDTGAIIEVFLIRKIEKDIWIALIKPSKRVKTGMTIQVSESLSVEILEKDDDKWKIHLVYQGNIFEILDKVGHIPLPPYIERKMTDDEYKNLDFDRYQTVFAQKAGAVAAPTAGLHFTKELLTKLEVQGTKHCFITLNVGLGTFKPVKCENILEHKMDSESFEITQETADIINNAKAQGKNIVAVGTTSVRTLETVMNKYGNIKACKDSSELFIYPGYEFKIVDKLITNFHLPKSTLLMLVSAFSSKDFIFNAYDEAIKNNYRFYSYGDCMFIK